MARVETIVVGGGIAATAPFTTGAIPLISASVPPALSDSIMRQTATGIVVGVTDPGGTEKFRTIGGIVSASPGFLGSTVIGKGAVALNNDVISIGTGAGVGALLAQAGINIGGGSVAEGSGIALGVNAFANANSGTGAHIVIGPGARSNNGGAGADSVVIGGGLIVSGSRIVAIACNNIGGGVSGSICIGTSAVITGTVHDVICMGRSASINAEFGCIAMGTASVVQAGHDGAQVYGYGATSIGPGCVVWGADVAGVEHIDTFVFGGDTQDVTEDKLLRFANASAIANNLGRNAIVQAPLSRGNATPGAIQFRCGIVGASSAVLQTLRTSLQIQTSVVATETDLLLYDVDNATLERVTVGAADSGGVGFKLLRIPN